MRADTLVNDNERLRLELARLTDQLAHKGGDCAAGILVPGVILGAVPDGTAAALADAKPIERGAGPDMKDKPQDANIPGDKNGADKNDPNKSKANANNPEKDNKDAKKDDTKPMVVPPEAKQKQTLAFLKGDWQSAPGLPPPRARTICARIMR